MSKGVPQKENDGLRGSARFLGAPKGSAQGKRLRNTVLQGTLLRLQIGQFDNKKCILLFSLFDCWFHKNVILHFNIDIEANIRGKMTVFQKNESNYFQVFADNNGR